MAKPIPVKDEKEAKKIKEDVKETLEQVPSHHATEIIQEVIEVRCHLYYGQSTKVPGWLACVYECFDWEC